MNDEQNLNTEAPKDSSGRVSPMPPPPKIVTGGESKGHGFFIIPLVILLMAAAGYCGYWYAVKYKTSSDNAPVQSSKSSVEAAAPSVHFVQSQGFPYDTAPSKNEFVTKLGVPGSMQAVRISSNNSNRGLEQIFTNYFNNELGRWVFGNPSDPEDNGGASSELSLLAITNQWLTSTGTTDFTDYGYGSPMETPAQKQQFISQLKNQTGSCVKDSAKGFATEDGNLKVCFTYNYGKEGYEASVSFQGYGDIQSQQVVLLGTIFLPPDNTVGTNQNAQFKAISDAEAGHVPFPTAQAQRALISALKQTSVTVTPNP